MPSFSVIIPTFNCTNVVLRAIQSIFNQTINDWELILVDDGSTDDTFLIISPYIKETNFRYFFQENAGVSQARNTGAEKATGNWLLFLDSDDKLELNALDGFLRALDDFPDEQVFVSGYKRVLSEISKGSISIPSTTKGLSTLSGTFLIKKDLFISLNGYDPKFKFGENSELFRRVRASGVEPRQLNFVSLIYFDKPEGGSKNMKNMEASTRLMLEKHAHYFERTPNEKQVYLQIIGVCNLRMGNYKQARLDFWEAYRIDMSKIDTLGRFIISTVPFLARYIYPTTEFR